MSDSIDYGNIKIPRDKWLDHRDRKDDLGMTWSEYIDSEAPELGGMSPDDIREIIRAELNDLEARLTKHGR